jgi:F-type H+-transporting ATPase subunit a
MIDPLNQFQINRLIPISLGEWDISYTNSALWMTIGLIIVCLFFHASLKREALVPNRLQASSEIIFCFLSDMVKTYIGREGVPFFPFIFTLFWFVLIGNLLGLIPYSFTYTSHIVVTFTLAIVAFIAANVAGFKKHGIGMFSLLLPKGIPLFLAPLMAGHLILKLFASFSLMLGKSSLAVLGILPLILNIGVTGLEFLVAVLQTYVFTLLTCLYINDAINLH